MQFTQDQQKVIDTRKKNILVSAAAGSGKTAVLVQRILSLITDPVHPVDIDRLLIVTFTSAAAAEMRERIHAAIIKEMEKDPMNENLQRQSTLIHNAMITTIDSFCMFLLRNHFHEIDLDPAFRIGDPGEIKLIEKEVLADVLEEFYALAEPDFLEFVDAYCPEGKEGKIEEMIEELYHYSMSHPWPLKWLKECQENTSQLSVNTLMEKNWMKYGIGLAMANLEDAREIAKHTLLICEQPDGPYMYAGMIEEDIKQLDGFCNAFSGENQQETFHYLSQQITKVKWAALSRKSDESVNVDKKEAVKALRDRYKKMITSLKEQIFKEEPAMICLKETMAGNLNKCLLKLTTAFSVKLSEIKKEKNILDFADAEHFALQILIGDNKITQTAETYRDFFEEIMIDEYQDSNDVQELLLASIARTGENRNNRFMVGDMKQSIYKFRLAKPEIFMDKYAVYQKETDDNCLIGLKKNFRSRIEVLDSTNDVFSLVMRPQVGGILYDQDAALYPGADYPQEAPKEENSYRTELCLYEAGDDDKLSKRTSEAYMIAERIHQLVGSFEIVDTQKQKRMGPEEEIPMRKVSYRDIVILLRSGSNAAEEIRKVLASEAIPVHVTSKTGYFAANEVSLLMDLLKTLNNPYEDIPFCSVALSMFLGFTEEDLAFIRSWTKRGITLYESFLELSEKEAESSSGNEAGSETDTSHEKRAQITKKINQSLEILQELRFESGVKSMTDLVNLILRRFHYSEYITALPGGQQRKANVEMFVEKTVDYENTSYHGLFHFVRYMEQLQKYDVDYGEASTLAESADVVRIMTIHKSKGLEFPVCFVAGLDKRYNLRDTTSSVLMDVDWGIASDYVEVSRHVRGKTLRKIFLSQKMRRDSLGEELRILYVAMTRAKEKLILTASVDNADKLMENYAYLKDQKNPVVPTSELASANTNLSFIMMAYAVRPEHITLKKWKAEDLKMSQIEKIADREIQRQKLFMSKEIPLDQTETLNQLLGKFSYRYPHEDLAGLYTKTSVSELKKAAIEEEGVKVLFETDDADKVCLPAFLSESEKKQGGTDRGSAFHRLLELLDFRKYKKLNDESDAQSAIKKELKEDITRFIANGRMSQNYGDLISLSKISDFLQSDCALRLARAQEQGKLYKEQPFVIAIAANKVKPQFPASEKVLIQGIIDVYFEEEDGIVILDYKTDRIKSMDELKNRYQTQLDYYEEAVTQLRALPVKEKLLYSFALMQEYGWK